MSTYTQEVRRCDLTGEESLVGQGCTVQTVEFGLGKDRYEIELADDRADKLREALADYVEHARRTDGRTNTVARAIRARKAAPTPEQGAVVPVSPPERAPMSPSVAKAAAASQTEQNKAVRRWAGKVGYVVSSRGAIPEPVRAHYERVGGKTAGVTAEGRYAAEQGATVTELRAKVEPEQPTLDAPDPMELEPAPKAKTLDGERRQMAREWAQQHRPDLGVKDQGVVSQKAIDAWWADQHANRGVAASG